MAIDFGKKSSYIYIVVGDNGEVRTEIYSNYKRWIFYCSFGIG